MVLIVEGIKRRRTALPADVRTLALLHIELPLTAAALAAEIHGVKKNSLIMRKR